MPTQPAFPTPLHKQAADVIIDFFRSRPHVDAVLVVNSCARGTATPASDLDVAVLVDPAISPAEQRALEQQWRAFYATHPIAQQMRQRSRFGGVHLDVFDGQFVPERWDDGGGPDGFELEIGNRVAYSAPVWQASTAFDQLRSTWLPYYNETLRSERLAMVQAACRYDLQHVPFYVERALYFQAFDRLYKALQEFLQALFISHRTYPLAYNKWIREQIMGWLQLPELYDQLPPLLQITQLESAEMIGKAQTLERLLDIWLAE